MKNNTTLFRCLSSFALALYVLVPSASAQVTKDEVDAAKNAIDLRVYQETQDLLVQQKTAEARKAIAEAEKAEAAAKVPPSDSKTLPGTVNTEKFGAAGLIKAFDLAKDLSVVVCNSIKSGTNAVVIYDASTVQGVVSARLVESEIAAYTTALRTAQSRLDADTKSNKQDLKFLPIAGVVGGIKAIADLTSLFKTNVVASSTPYEAAAVRSLFTTLLAENCPLKVAGLGSGYLGELDITKYEQMRASLNVLYGARQALEEGIVKTKNALKAK